MTATETIRDVLDKVSTEYPLLLVDDYSIRADYLKEYADLLGASYMEVRDPAGKKVCSTGTPDPGAEAELIISDNSMDAQDVFRPTIDKTGVLGYERDLKEGYRLYYEISNEALNDIAAYLIRQDDQMKTRSVLKEIEGALGLKGLFVFRQDGRVLVTSTNYDHLDFEEDLNHVEEIIKRELPTMQGNLAEAGFVDNRMGYGGVSALDSTGYKLVFIAACHPDKEIVCRCSMNGELLKMCNRNGIRVAYQHVIVDASE